MEIASVVTETAASALVAPFGGSGGFRNVLPTFRRELDTALIDSAVVFRITGATVIDTFPDIERDSVPVINDEGTQAKFAKLNLMLIRVGKIDQASPYTGNVTITVNDMFGDYAHTFDGPGELLFCLETAVATTGSSSLSVSYGSGAGNIGVEVLLVGKETA